MGGLVRHRDEPKAAVDLARGDVLGQREAGRDTFELVAVDATDGRQRRAVGGTGELDHRESVIATRRDRDATPDEMGHRGAVLMKPPALTIRGWIVDNPADAVRCLLRN